MNLNEGGDHTNCNSLAAVIFTTVKELVHRHPLWGLQPTLDLSN